ncbi:hypothetical protein [Haloarchaeobius sp. HRN-SO-5]|uniref:hypothetical protein n=1 Tax=Haloarchaeobius sp. HRN-SO-5 TaxID=3446118 RepID=UPI003EBFA6FF
MESEPNPVLDIGFLEETEIHDHAEDVKSVRFIGTNGAFEVQVTDDSMQAFAETAEAVFKQIHVDMGDMRELFDPFDTGYHCG